MSGDKKRDRLRRDFLLGKTPFALDESTYHRFSERNTIFSRVGWDTSYRAFRKGISDRESELVGKKGYSRFGFAASPASWMVHDYLAREFSQEDENLQSTDFTQVSSKLPRYESGDLKLNSDRVKRLAQIFGACDAGITNIGPKQQFIYTHTRKGEQINLPVGVKHVIVLLIQMDYSALMTSPKLPASITVGNAYSRAAFAVNCLADVIRNLGYQAIPSVNSTGLSVPLAVLAGLGEFGRNGLLIHPKFGQSIRIAKVFTDFPLNADSPINFGAFDFCRACKKCAKFCPSQSISEGEPTWESPWNTPSNNNGVYKWYVNADTCYEFWARNATDCSNCVRVCPFTKPPGIVHDFVRFFIRNLRFLNRFWIKLDDFLGYGKSKDPDEFWESETYLNQEMKR